MKKFFVLIILFAFTASFLAADSVVGYWLSIDEKTNKVTAGWQIYLENNVLFGRILSLADEPRGTIADRCRESYNGFPVRGRVNTMPVAGTPWIFGLTMHRPGDWRGGSIINPEDGRMYNCRIIFHAADGRRYQKDTLEMRGEIGLGIGRSQFWQKTDEATASNLWPN
ncbi:MAG: DUF2147 domain-containing protein [Treponema sp.]|nr:DUF2147 domain-containing protein [Treponema sp.]